MRYFLFSLFAAVTLVFGAAPVATAQDVSATPISDALDPAEQVIVGEESTPVAPGVTHTAFDWVDARGFVRGDLLTVELDGSGVTSDLLTPVSVAATAPLSQLAAARSAPDDGDTVIAGVNGDFFDISDTGAPIHASIDDGMLLNSSTRSEERTYAGVDTTGVGGLLDVAIDGTVTLPGGEEPLDGLNQSQLRTDGDLGAYTAAWGDTSLARVVDGASTVTAVVVDSGTVRAVTDDPAAAEIPAGGYVLVGRGSAAETLGQLDTGDAVSLSYSARTTPEGEYEWAIGASAAPIVVDGEVQDLPGSPFYADTTLAPRTGIGFSADGGIAYLVTVDGRQSFSRGLSVGELGDLMASLGADDAANLDGGGSSTLLARDPGEGTSEIENDPSDGNERAVANGIGILAGDGDGAPTGITVTPSSTDDDAGRVHQGLSRTLTATGFDATYGPAEINPRWSSSAPPSTVSPEGVVTARRAGPTEITATDGQATGTMSLDVIGPATRITTEPEAVPLADGDTTGSFIVAGFDADGFRAPIAPSDVTLNYDETVAEVTPDGTGSYTVTPRTSSGATLITATVGDVTTTVAVTIGLERVTLDDFDDPLERWYATTYPFDNVGASVSPGPGDGDDSGLRLDYDFSQTSRTRAAYVRHKPERLELPGQPRGIGLQVNGDGNGAWLRGYVYDAVGSRSVVNFASEVDWTGWRTVEAAVPQGVQYPITLQLIYAVETDSDAQYSGSLAFDDLHVLVPPSVDVPETPDVRDPIISQNGIGEDRSTYAVMADAQFTADNPDSETVALARQTLREIRASDAEFLIINGDFTDLGRPEDFELARRILDEELEGELPYYYVPGNHESYQGDADGGTGLENFRGEFGETRRTFDRNGTRYILLNSALGSFRTSEFAQMPWLRDLLDDAAADPSIEHVALFSHYPPYDPLPAANSDLADPKESRLIEEWLTDFEQTSGKDAAYIGAGVGAFDARRVDGVPYLIIGNSGKNPAGGPANGGFTGWARMGVEPIGANTDQWLAAQVRPRLEDILIDAPANVAVRDTAAATITGVQEDGARHFPLDWPASVDYRASVGVHIGSPDTAGPNALLAYDPATDALTGLRPGTATLIVASGEQTAEAVITVGNGNTSRRQPAPLPVPPVPAAATDMPAVEPPLTRRPDTGPLSGGSGEPDTEEVPGTDPPE